LADELDRNWAAVGRLETIVLLREDLARVLVDPHSIGSDWRRWRNRDRQRKQRGKRNDRGTHNGAA